MASLEERFHAKVVMGPNGCWCWSGFVMKNGYGNTGTGLAHRLSYTIHRGPIPDGMQIDHLCRNRRCVNPDHLEAVTSRENTMRGLNFSAVNARKTHCPQGHEYTPENTNVSSRNQRKCRRCDSDRHMAKYYERKNRESA